MLAAAGITNADEFSAFYWNQQLNTALGLVIATVVASAAGGVVFRLANSTKPATTVPGGSPAALTHGDVTPACPIAHNRLRRRGRRSVRWRS